MMCSTVLPYSTRSPVTRSAGPSEYFASRGSQNPAAAAQMDHKMQRVAEEQ